MTTETQLVDRLATRFEAVTETEKAKTLLSENSLEQQIVFAVNDGTNITIQVQPHSTDLTVRVGPEDPKDEYQLFKTTVITVESDVVEELLAGDLLSTHYLRGEFGLDGIPPVWSILGPLFRINSELLEQRP